MSLDPFTLCACMGPQYTDPYCPCEMKRRNLPSYEKSAEEQERDRLELNRILTNIFHPQQRKPDEIV